MKDIWYCDKRDVVKWATLLHLADANKATDIVQVGYHRKSTWPSLDVDGTGVALPPEVLAHVRSVKNGLGSGTRFKIFVHVDGFRSDTAASHAAYPDLREGPGDMTVPKRLVAEPEVSTQQLTRMAPPTRFLATTRPVTTKLSLWPFVSPRRAPVRPRGQRAGLRASARRAREPSPLSRSSQFPTRRSSSA